MHKRNKHQTSRAAGIEITPQIEVVFALERAGANRVFLCGDFNEWSPTNLPMIERAGGRWEKRLMLPPGCYEYKFLVDGAWISDPAAAQVIPNAFGSANSVVVVHGLT